MGTIDFFLFLEKSVRRKKTNFCSRPLKTSTTAGQQSDNYWNITFRDETPTTGPNRTEIGINQILARKHPYENEFTPIPTEVRGRDKTNPKLWSPSSLWRFANCTSSIWTWVLCRFSIWRSSIWKCSIGRCSIWECSTGRCSSCRSALEGAF